MSTEIGPYVVDKNCNCKLPTDHSVGHPRHTAKISLEEFGALVDYLGGKAMVHGCNRLSLYETVNVSVDDKAIVIKTEDESCCIKFVPRPDENLTIKFNKNNISAADATGHGLRFILLDARVNRKCPEDVCLKDIIPEFINSGKSRGDLKLHLGSFADLRADLTLLAKKTLTAKKTKAASKQLSRLSGILMSVGKSTEDTQGAPAFDILNISLTPDYIEETNKISITGQCVAFLQNQYEDPGVVARILQDAIMFDAPQGAYATVTVVPSTGSESYTVFSISFVSPVNEINFEIIAENKKRHTVFIGNMLNTLFAPEGEECSDPPKGMTFYTVPANSKNNSSAVYAVLVGMGMSEYGAILDYLDREEDLLEERASSAVLDKTEGWMIRIQLKNQKS